MKFSKLFWVVVSLVITFGNFVALMMAGFWLELAFPVLALISVVVLLTDFRYWYMLGHGGVPNVLVTLAWFIIGIVNTGILYLFAKKLVGFETTMFGGLVIVWMASAVLIAIKLWCANNYANLMEERASA